MSDGDHLFKDAIFGPELNVAMGVAYERAWARINPQAQVDLVKDLLACRILELARQGHADAEVLYKRALKAFGFDRTRG